MSDYDKTLELSEVFESLIALDELFSGWIGSTGLNPEARLICVIAARGSLSVKEAMYDSSLSNRAFYQMINRMKRAGRIKVRADPNDGRVRRIVIEPVFFEASPLALKDLERISNAFSLAQRMLAEEPKGRRLVAC